MTDQPTGPRGGTTTRTKTGLHRVVVLFHDDEYEALRRAAYDRNDSRSAIVRQAVREHLDIED